MRFSTKHLRRILLQSASEIAIGEVQAAEAWMEALAEEAFLARYRSAGMLRSVRN